MSEEVSINKTQLDELLEQNRQLLAGQQARDEQINQLLANQDPNYRPVLRDEDEEKKIKVRVCFIDDKPVLGFANRGSEARPTFIYERPHPTDPNKRIGYVDLRVEGEDSPISVEYTEFMREADARELLVVDVKEEPWTIEQGTVSKKIWNGDAMVETDQLVAVRAKGVHRTFVVERPGGGEPITISEDYVNIR